MMTSGELRELKRMFRAIAKGYDELGDDAKAEVFSSIALLGNKYGLRPKSRWEDGYRKCMAEHPDYDTEALIACIHDSMNPRKMRAKAVLGGPLYSYLTTEERVGGKP
jgi:hypothetical protein